MYDYTLDKNMKVKYIDHHRWPTMKHFKITLKQSQKETFGPENKWLKTSYLAFIY